MNDKLADPEIPGEILSEFQDIVDLLAEIIAVPTALILKVNSPYIEVLCTNNSGGNPFKTGERIPLEDQFFTDIISEKREFSVAKISTNKKWETSFPGKQGMVSFLGDVLAWPKEKTFGIICVMDAKENKFSSLNKKLLTGFKRAVEKALRLLYSETESLKHKSDLKGAAEKLESVGILAGGIAQDFNSLLSVIIGNISLARMEVPPGEKVYDLLLESEKASCQAADIAEKLITFSEGGWLVRREERLVSLVKEMINSSSLPPGISFNINIPLNLPSIFVDEGQFKQVLLNIFLNAAEATPAGGEVRIHADNITVENNEFPMLKPGQYVKLSIKDRGPGIPKEHLKKIFDPYFSTKNSLDQRGMGLGLSICYSIIKKHEGWITVESGEGAGTTVCLYIPVFDEKSAEKALNV